MKNNQKSFVVPLLIIIALLVIGGVYFYNNKNSEVPTVVDNGTQQTITQNETATTIAPLILNKTSPSTTSSPKTVILVIDNNLYKDSQVSSVIDRYKKDYIDYKFITILFNKTNNLVTDLTSKGGNIKQNSLEVRNEIKKIYNSKTEKLAGVFVIGNIRPTIWRDANLWRSLGQSGFYPSIYPFVALDSEYYSSFDVINDGFYEKPGMTTGSEVGGGYNASIWGGVLIPPTTDNLKAKKLIINYFNRDHTYITKQLTYSNKLLYSDSFGCSSNLYQKVNSNSIWGATSNTFLCPNSPNLGGFDSLYQVYIQTAGYDETNGFGGITATTDEEKKEFSSWSSNDYFNGSRLILAGGPHEYYFYLRVTGKSISTEQIKEMLKNNLPPIICGTIMGGCSVHAFEYGFDEAENSNLNWNGAWNSYLVQQSIWTKLYTNFLKDNNVQLTFINTHGSTNYHLFNITSDTVKSGNFNSMIYEIESCNTGNYLLPDYIAGDYLFYGNTLGVSAYSIPFVMQAENGYIEADEYLRFLKINKDQPVINALFLKNYGNYIYFGDPLLQLNSNLQVN